MKLIRERGTLTGIALGGAATLALLFAVAGGAEVPPSSMGCQADGKISGRGSTFQDWAQSVLSAGFTADICGDVPDDPADPGDPPAPAGNNMVEYNEYTPGGFPAVGSGYGLDAMACRTDAFGGTDIPYTTAQLQALDTSVGSPEILGSGNTCETPPYVGFGTSFLPPFPPEDGGSYPGPSDQAAPMMTFPVAGTAIAVIANLTGGPAGSGATCENATSAAPTSLELDSYQLSLLFGGAIFHWDDTHLTSNNPDLVTDNCSGPVTRVVSADDAGSTSILMTYLHSGGIGDCSGAGETWLSFAGNSPNTAWPGFVPVGTTPGQYQAEVLSPPEACTAIQQGYVTGDDGILDACIGNTGGGSPYAGIPGAICYADLPDFEHFGDAAPNGGGPGGVPGCSPCTGVVALVQNGTLTSYQPPAKVTTANCSFGAVTAPTGADGSVGLTTGPAFTPGSTIPAGWDTWADDNPEGNRGDVTDTGSDYPICGLTFDMVYTGLADGTQPNAIAALTPDQRRTLYAYFSYILSSAGQNHLAANFYQALTPSLLPPIREQFQKNF